MIQLLTSYITMPFWTTATQKKHIRVIKKYWKAIEYVPDVDVTKEMGIIAVKQSWEALQWIPRPVQTKKICTIAIKQSWEAIKWSNHNVFTEEMYIIAVKQSWEALQWIPSPAQTNEICTIAIKQSWGALKWSNYDVFTEELCIAIIKHSWLSVGLIRRDIIINSDSFYSSLLESDFSMPASPYLIPRVFYDNFIKAIWAKYDEPRAMLEILKRITIRYRCFAPPPVRRSLRSPPQAPFYKK
jgi:hypothetical protein